MGGWRGSAAEPRGSAAALQPDVGAEVHTEGRWLSGKQWLAIDRSGGALSHVTHAKQGPKCLPDPSFTGRYHNLKGQVVT